MRNKTIPGYLLLSALACTPALQAQLPSKIKHVLEISIDGMHSLDMQLYVKSNPSSNLAQLMANAVNYTNAWATANVDSIPSTAGIFTGGTPAVTGLYYDDAWNRSLFPAGSNCTGAPGAFIDLKQTWDINPTAADGGGGIDPNKVPLDASKGCAKVFPHNLLRVNTVFEVIHSHGGYTAYSEKRPSYEFLNGPSGVGLNDLYAPEIAFNNILSSVALTEAFDQLRVQSVLNEIDGKNHDGSTSAPVPALFGMNFQSINAAKKDDPNVTTPNGVTGSGYADSFSTPDGVLVGALNYVDGAIGSMIAELKNKGLYNSTAIVIMAKHAESPLDPNRRTFVPPSGTGSIAAIFDGTILTHKITFKSNAFIWLTDQTQTQAAVSKLLANQAGLHIGQVLSGESLKLLFPDPLTDPATPDIIVFNDTGVNYDAPTSATTAEHGGLGENDRHVPLFVSFPGWSASTQRQPVTTTQLAPTVLTLLGYNPLELQAVQIEGTVALPAVITQYLLHLF